MKEKSGLIIDFKETEELNKNGMNFPTFAFRVPVSDPSNQEGPLLYSYDPLTGECQRIILKLTIQQEEEIKEHRLNGWCFSFGICGEGNRAPMNQLVNYQKN